MGMANGALLASLDLLLRGGVCMLLLLVALLLLRDYRGQGAARLGACFALGVAAYAICSAAGFHARLGWWAIPIMALAAGNNMVFWLFARALFDDGFRARPWHAGLWIATVAVGLVDGLILESEPTGLRLVLTLEALGFALLAAAQTLASWRADLVERRRRLRVFIVGASAAYIGLPTLANLLGAQRTAPLAVSVIEACGLAAIAGAVAWSLLRVASDASLFPLPAAAPTSAAASAAAPRPGVDPADQGLVAALQRVMTVERAYRQDGLTIGRLAGLLDLPEYRLRQLINQGLGYRNFNAFLNQYRIAEAKAALADPGQAAVPVLTIALDAGFNSLGPFNRAFKAETGMTPSEYRRSHGGNGAVPPAESKIGGPVAASAGRISNSA